MLKILYIKKTFPRATLKYFVCDQDAPLNRTIAVEDLFTLDGDEKTSRLLVDLRTAIVDLYANDDFVTPVARGCLE